MAEDDRGITVSHRSLEDKEAQKELPYGREYLAVGKAVAIMHAALDKPQSSPPEDVIVARSVQTQIETLYTNDKPGYIQRDLQTLTDQAQKQAYSQEKVTADVKLIQEIYGLSEAELAQAVRQKQLADISPHFRVTAPQIGFDFRGKGELSARLFHFTQMNIKTEKNGVTIKMEPVYDGGIDSLARPVHNLKLHLEPGQPVDLTLGLSFFRGQDLETEMAHHSDIGIFIKKELARVVDYHTHDQNKFQDERGSNGRKADTTQILNPLLKFISEDYLKKHLSPGDYKQIRQGLDFVYSDKMDAAVGLRTVVEELFDETSSTRTGWYSEKNPGKVTAGVVSKVSQGLTELGAVIEGNQIINFQDLTTKAMQDAKFAKKINHLWNSVFQTPTRADQIHAGMLKGELEGYTERYEWDLFRGVMIRGLEMARGIYQGHPNPRKLN